MTILAYIAGLIAAVALISVVLSLLLGATWQSGQQRKQDAETRNMARQPWDAQSADGRGNR